MHVSNDNDYPMGELQFIVRNSLIIQFFFNLKILKTYKKKNI